MRRGLTRSGFILSMGQMHLVARMMMVRILMMRMMVVRRNYEEEKGNSKDGEIGIYSVDGTQLHLAAAPRVTRGQLLYTACNCYSAYTSGREQFCTII